MMTYFKKSCLIAAISFLLHSTNMVAVDAADNDLKLAVYPEQIDLSSRQERQSVIAVLEQAKVVHQQLDSTAVEWKIDPPEIARWDNFQLIPTQNGTGTLQASYQQQTITIPLTVRGLEQPAEWSFRNQVQSVLTKHGCNSGACHGAAAGKNGFRLSLRGYDPDFDHEAMTRQSRGRRIVPTDPGKSLLLTKPTGFIPHKGGVLLETGSRDYRVLAEWIAAGQSAPSASDARITRLEILPKKFRLQPGNQLQLIVQAHYSDGQDEDVTAWAKYTSHNESVVGIDNQGKLTVQGSGEGAVLAWYLAQNEIVTVSVPLNQEVDAELFKTAETTNLIDQQVLAKLQHLNIPPAAVCSDETFIRRVFLDTIGTLPTPAETRHFLADEADDKREKLIDHVLERPEFVDYWTYRWSDLLLVTSGQLRAEAVQVYYNWIRQHVEQNTPWDELVRELILSRGSALENGAVNFYAIHRDPLSLTENVSMAFLGMSMNCARCHDHPLEKWTNDDYYGMVSLFSRVKAKGWGGEVRNGNGDRVVFLSPEGEVIQPRIGQPQPPRPLDGMVVDPASLTDRRESLADWLTHPDNPYFTKAIVNRVWANFLSVGIVENVDDLRLTNPPSNPELFDALASYLVEQKYDLRQLMRLILQSKTYQRASETSSGNAAETRYYSHYYPRRLRAEVLLDAVSQVTGSPTLFTQKQQAGGGLEKIEVASGTKAQQLADTSIVSFFLETFGRPERLTTCECERSSEPSMSQVLHIMNGGTLNEKLSQPDNHLQQLLNSRRPDYQIIEEAYLSALSRFPTDAELQQILPLLQQAESPAARREVTEDIFWSLMSTNEFLFNR